MLGKLLKHEWKSVYKFGSILLLAIVIVTALGYFFLRSSIIGDMFSEGAVVDEAQSFALFLMGLSGFILYCLLLTGATYGIIIYMGVHFYKTMYTDQGYLTHTLPVKPGQILASKVLVSGAWTFLVCQAVYASIVILVIGFVQGITNGVAMDMTFAEFWHEMSAVYGEMGFDVTHFVVILVLLCLIAPFTAIIQVFGAITVGQLSKKHKLMMGILAYIGFWIVNFIITMIIETVISIKYMVNMTDELSMEFMSATYDVSLIYSCVVAIVLYIVSHYIIKKKLNMD